MSLFPHCTFQVLVPNGRMTAGEHIEGELVLTVPEPIPRAEQIVLIMESRAWAGTGDDATAKLMFRAGFKFDLPKDAPFAAGQHRYPFVLDLPEWLPPSMDLPYFRITHTVRALLDVDWAVDPVATLTPIIELKPKRGTRLPIIMRSHPSFHEEIVVEVTLTSGVVSLDEMVTGEVALRSGSIAQLEWIDLKLLSVAKAVMGGGDRRNIELARARIPAARLRDGAAARFAIPFPPAARPSFRSSFIDHDVVLQVSAQIPWHLRPTFEIPLDVLPVGSVIDGEGSTSAVGGSRVRRLSRAMAEQTGLIEGARRPTLVHGSIGAVKLAIRDAAVNGVLGVDLDFTFPDLELGILFGEPGMIDLIRPSHETALLPLAFANYRLKCEPPDARPKIHDLALAKLFQTILGNPAQAQKVRLSDHHLGFHVALADDEAPRMIEIARAAVLHAKVIADAISELPFPMPLIASRPAWQTIATEQNAFLIPTGPTIHGLTLREQVVGGEERSMRATLRTTWKSSAPMLQAVLDLSENPLVESLWPQLSPDSPSETLKSVRAIFPSIQLSGREGKIVVLEDARWLADPRPAISILETFLSWLIEARGERRVDSPYR